MLYPSVIPREEDAGPEFEPGPHRAMELDVRSMRIITAIARARSLAHAASDQRIPLAVLITRLRRIEAMVGTPLIHRSTDGFALTDLGHFVATRCTQVVDGIAELERSALDFASSQGPDGPLWIGVPSTVSVGPIAAAARDGFSGRDVRCRESVTVAELRAGLTDGRLDLAVFAETPGFEAPRTPGVDAITIMEREPTMAAVSTGHPLTALPEVRMADLAGQEFICGVPSDDGMVAKLRLACGEAGFEPTVAHYLTQAQAGIHLVRTTGVVGFAASGSRDHDGIVYRPIAVDSLSRRVTLHWRVESVLAREIDRFAADLVERCMSDLADKSYFRRGQTGHWVPGYVTARSVTA